MAKVTMPLLSGSASGKIADAMVHFTWKGISVVRQWLKPANPMSAGQGNRRIMLGGLGRAVGEVRPSSTIHAKLITLGLIPSGQTKQSYLVKYIADHYITNGTSYVAELALCTGHTSYAAFGASADTLGIVAFDLDYADKAPFDKALGLYLLAKAGIALGFTGAPWTTALTAWVTASVTAMVAQMTVA